jgi:DNA modification methylase
MKPVGLVERMIGWSSRRGEIVLDLFGGSGTTLIASHKIGRACRTMELDPKYSDVIVKRWQEFTGETATLATSGLSFDAVASQRDEEF